MFGLRRTKLNHPPNWITVQSPTLEWPIALVGEKLDRLKSNSVHLSMIFRLACFTLIVPIAYLVLSSVFRLVCVGLGHNNLEMLYGGTAVYLFTLAAAAEGAYFLPEDIRSSSSFTRLTQRFRSSPDWRLR